MFRSEYGVVDKLSMVSEIYIVWRNEDKSLRADTTAIPKLKECG